MPSSARMRMRDPPPLARTLSKPRGCAGAAVYSMSLEIGERRVVADIQRKEAAKKVFEQARNSGKRAALVEADEGNLFRTAVTNVAPGETVARVAPLADEVICAYVPRVFQGVGQFYGDFAQTADAQVTELLARSRVEPAE